MKKKRRTNSKIVAGSTSRMWISWISWMTYLLRFYIFQKIHVPTDSDYVYSKEIGIPHYTPVLNLCPFIKVKYYLKVSNWFILQKIIWTDSNLHICNVQNFRWVNDTYNNWNNLNDVWISISHYPGKYIYSGSTFHRDHPLRHYYFQTRVKS